MTSLKIFNLDTAIKIVYDEEESEHEPSVKDSEKTNSFSTFSDSSEEYDNSFEKSINDEDIKTKTRHIEH